MRLDITTFIKAMDTLNSSDENEFGKKEIGALGDYMEPDRIDEIEIEADLPNYTAKPSKYIPKDILDKYYCVPKYYIYCYKLNNEYLKSHRVELPKIKLKVKKYVYTREHIENFINTQLQENWSFQVLKQYLNF